MDQMHSFIVAGCQCPFCASAREHDSFEAAAGAGVTGGADAAKPVFTLSQIVTQLRTQWGGTQEGKTWTWLNTSNITYSMPDSGPSGRSESAGYVQMTAAMKDTARLAFELWDDVIAISLTESTNNVNANITFNYSSKTNNNGTYASWNGTTAGTDFAITRAYIWLNSTWASHDQDSDLFLGGYGLTTYLHEIGHSLGLSHAGTYNAGQGGLSYANSAEYFQDSRKFTLMSYWDADDAEPAVDHYGQSGAWRYGSTPLLHDIAALQAAYGADMTTRTGDTTYGFNSNAGRAVYDFTLNRDPIICIWDAAGIDTLDCSGFAINQFINLNAGTFSNVGFMTENVSIAFGAIIENAVGGNGADVLFGNAVNNTLNGGLGLDTYVFTAGGWGRDIVVDVNFTGRIVFTGVSDVGSLLHNFTGVMIGSNYVLTCGSNGSQITFQNMTSVSNWTFGYSGLDAFNGSDWTTLTFQELVCSQNATNATHDFNGDGTSDILWRNTLTGDVGAWEMHNGAASWRGISSTGTSWRVLDTADVNGDHTTDILVATTSNGVTYFGYWEMQNSAVTGYHGIGAAGAGWSFVGTGDFNGDATDDILWRNSSTGDVGISEMRDGVADWRGIGSTGTLWNVLGTADVNGDGTTDILVGTTNNGVTAFGYWEMHNSTVSGYHGIGASGAGWNIVGTGDFNGDGTDDILWRNSSTGDVGASEMHNGVASWVGIGSTGTSWDVLGTADVNSDDITDILVGATKNGVIDLGYWEMHNSANTGYHGIGSAESNWLIQ